MKTQNFLFTVLFILAASLFVSAQSDCNINLAAKNNRTIKTIKNLSYTYTLTVSNLGSETSEIEIFANNANESCENPDGLSNEYNIPLENLILDEGLNPINTSIELGAGESFTFFVKLSTSANSSQERWNCTEVSAEVNNCSSDPQKILLHTYNPNPLEME